MTLLEDIRYPSGHSVLHIACLKGCLDYLGDSWLCGGTGHAFVINIHKVQEDTHYSTRRRGADMTECDYGARWYHGSPEMIAVLRKGSWVTQFKEMAKAFSHKPSLMSLADDCQSVKHDGKVPGFLYMVSESLGPDDVSYLRDTANTHWQTERDLQISIVAELAVDDPPLLNEEEIAVLRKDMPEGSTGFVGTSDRD